MAFYNVMSFKDIVCQNNIWKSKTKRDQTVPPTCLATKEPRLRLKQQTWQMIGQSQRGKQRADPGNRTEY